MTSSEARDEPAAPTLRGRILGAAFSGFIEKGYAGLSMLEIATRARISKRDLYAEFANKEAILVACIRSRSARLGDPPELPVAKSRDGLQAILTAIGARALSVMANPAAVTMFQIAIAEARRSPEVAEALDANGRKITRTAFVRLVEGAQAQRLIDAGDPAAMSDQFYGLLWERLMLALVMGLAELPTPEEIEVRAARAAAAFMTLHPAP